MVTIAKLCQLFYGCKSPTSDLNLIAEAGLALDSSCLKK